MEAVEKRRFDRRSLLAGFFFLARGAALRTARRRRVDPVFRAKQEKCNANGSIVDPSYFCAEDENEEMQLR